MYIMYKHLGYGSYFRISLEYRGVQDVGHPSALEPAVFWATLRGLSRQSTADAKSSEFFI